MAGLVVLAWIVDGTPKPVPDAFFRDGAVERPEYTVLYDERRSRRWSCTCPHHVYRHLSCKHIEACKPGLAKWLRALGEEPSARGILIREAGG